MPDLTKECPLCGASMQYRQTSTPIQVPGNPNATARVTSEWICPDCDYFEEADEDDR